MTLDSIFSGAIFVAAMVEVTVSSVSSLFE
jgi:hypothetical protein